MPPGDGPHTAGPYSAPGWDPLAFHMDGNTELVRIFDLTWIA